MTLVARTNALEFLIVCYVCVVFSTTQHAQAPSREQGAGGRGVTVICTKQKQKELESVLEATVRATARLNRAQPHWLHAKVPVVGLKHGLTTH